MDNKLDHDLATGNLLPDGSSNNHVFAASSKQPSIKMKLQGARSPCIDHQPAMILGREKKGVARDIPLSARSVETRAKCNMPDSFGSYSILVYSLYNSESDGPSRFAVYHLKVGNCVVSTKRHQSTA